MNALSSLASTAATQTAAPTSGASSHLTLAQLFKLRKAATEFESMLLANWWRSMKESGLPGSDDSTDPGHDTLDQLGIQAVSSAVAAGGGLGIGALLVRGLLSNALHSGAALQPAVPQTPEPNKTTGPVLETSL